ncbi:toll-like receptor Tollo [Phymastichus coffea]|uniref:toll-like receptor Tollo n=1 Tax=Phymastichus coffea TaxID=108790 RepID=UPI00273C6F1A|nr:toll-like receptor Tollo [Phymastichus coffea]
MQANPAVLALFFGTVLCVLGASLSKALRYKPPDECQWLIDGGGGGGDDDDDDDDKVALVCKLRTINSELENTNFSLIQPQHTVRLRLECSDALFYQSSLSAGSFRPLVELRELVIEYCKIGNLSDDAFRGLKQLRNLTVRTYNSEWSSMALEVSPRAFTEELSQLEKLDLGNNNMWSLPEGSLCPLFNLEVLNLTRNRLRELASFKFNLGSRCAANLRIIDLSNNSIESLPSAVFSALSRLHSLNLKSNNIAFIADRAFEGLGALTSIQLSNNRLGSLPPDLFAESRDIKEIHLRNNTLAVLPPGLFSELTQLLVLDLSANELSAEWINSATFTGLVRLVVLDLSDNQISRLESSVFRDLYSLQILRLQENLIDYLQENTFGALSNLHTLVLSDNRLSTIDATTFRGLHVLSLLSLDNNRLTDLHPTSLKNASSLQDLHLNGNRLMGIPEALKATPLLRALDLGENLISELPKGAFDHMTHLSGLRLIDNNIGNLTKGIFDKIRELNILNLSGNRIQRIEPGTFDENLKLQAIRLDGNQLTTISNLFSNLPNLVWLNVSDNKLRTFDYAMIPTALLWLDIHANEISELGNYYEIESQLHLNTFDASVNRLTEITGSSIPTSVEMLYLNDNLISRVQSYAFFKKPNLTRVDLKGNRIRRIEPYALRITEVPSDKPLPEFYIGDNDYLCDCTMEWLQRVNRQNQNRVQPRVMDLESIYCKLLYDRERLYVPLVEASHSQFLCKYDTHCFAICHCCDFDACDCEMTCPTNCTCYHDQTWTANVVDCAAAGHVARLPGQIPMDATHLYLDGNDLRSIASHAFIGRKKLKTLFLNGSNVELLHNRSFNGLRNLEELHLQDNGLRELRGHEFLGLDALRTLRLERNKLWTIANETFQALPALASLSLQNNRLTTLAVWTLPVSIEVNFAGNPWTCDCEFVREYREWSSNPSVRVVDSAALRCAYNSSLDDEAAFGDGNDLGDSDDAYGFSLSSGKADQVNGSMCAELEPIGESSGVAGNFTKTIIERQALEDYLPLLVSTLVAFLLLLLICMLGFLFRHEVRVWFYSRFGIRLFYRHADVDRDDRDKLFDAFVSYSSKDEAFVAEELAPVLEMGNPSYKLCLHYRDFPVGSFIADTIVQAVESSRRTIMVLSDNFIKSEWCRFDFKSAHHQVLRDRRRRLILVLVGEVPQRDLDPDIRLYLKTNTYLQWGDKLFWEKLRFALPDVPNNQRQQRRQQPTPVRRQHNNHMASPTERSRTLAVHI